MDIWLLAIGIWIPFGFSIGQRHARVHVASNWTPLLIDFWTLVPYFKKKLAIKKLCLIFLPHPGIRIIGKFKTEVLEISFHPGGRAGLPPARRISKPHVGAFQGRRHNSFFFWGQNFEMQQPPKKEKKKKEVHGKRVQRNFLEKILNIR